MSTEPRECSPYEIALLEESADLRDRGENRLARAFDIVRVVIDELRAEVAELRRELAFLKKGGIK